MSSAYHRFTLRLAFAFGVAFSLSCQLDQLIQPSQPAGIVVDPPAVADSAPLGSTASRNVSLSIKGEDPNSTWRASTTAGSPWLHLARMEDTIPSSVAVSLMPTGLAVGAYQDTIVLTGASNNQAVRVPVRFTVMSPPPPAPTGVPRLVFAVQPSKEVSRAALTPPVRVEAYDASGKRSEAFAGQITVTLATNPGSGTLSGKTTVKASGGAATFTDLSIDRPGTGYTLRATADGMAAATSAPFDITNPARLNFVVQPSAVQVGGRIAPPVVMTALDANGNTAPDFNGTVTIALGAHPGGATLRGTLSVSAAAGVVIFSDLTIDRAGNAYTLVAAASGFASAESHPFNVTVPPASATRSTITTWPGTIAASTGSSTTTVTVTVRDAAGNLLPGVAVTVSASGSGDKVTPTSGITSASGDMTAAFSSTSSGTKSISAVAGGVTISPSASVIVVAGSPTQLGFTVQPSDAGQNQVISPPVQVSVLDAFGNLVTSYAGVITIAVESGKKDALHGDRTRSAVSGVATFGDLNIDSGGDFSLRASAAGLTSAVSNHFKINN